MEMADSARSLPFRLASDGSPFLDLLDQRAAGDRRLRERVAALMLQWDHLREELGRAPTVEEYADRWKMPISTAYRAMAEFRGLFPSERDPARLLDLLWSGLAHHFGELLRVRVKAV